MFSGNKATRIRFLGIFGLILFFLVYGHQDYLKADDEQLAETTDINQFEQQVRDFKQQEAEPVSSPEFPDYNNNMNNTPEELITNNQPATVVPENQKNLNDASPFPVVKSNGKDSRIIDVMEFKNLDITDALKWISQKSGLNIVTGPGVQGKVTIYLKNVEVRDALKIILDTQNLAFWEEGGIIKVMMAKDFQLNYGYRFGENVKTLVIPLSYADATEISIVLNQMKSIIGKVIADKNSNSIILIDIPEKVDSLDEFIKKIDVERTTEILDLSYAQAEEISKKIPEFLTKNIGKVDIDTRSNKLIVTDIPEKMPLIKKIIEAIDVKEKIVLIESKIIQVVLSDRYKMGIDWQAMVAKYHNLQFTNSFDILDSTDKHGKINIGTLSDDGYEGFIEALSTMGTTDVLSKPSITVMNNKEAKILVGSTEPYITSTTVTPASGATTTSESVNFIEVGVKLYVTPTIHNNGFITMKIKPEVSSVLRSISTSNNNTIPVVETSEAETTVMVKDGVTIAIGGLMKDEKIKTVKKVPVLGDLPLLGGAFRSKDNSLTKTELIIFLTPRIISGEEDMK